MYTTKKINSNLKSSCPKLKKAKVDRLTALNFNHVSHYMNDTKGWFLKFCQAIHLLSNLFKNRLKPKLKIKTIEIILDPKGSDAKIGITKHKHEFLLRTVGNTSCQFIK
ncbi:hypothetical protein BpHYR1_024823 [Brachionus plicatilis]|uniref:Uncharacterized protein n=1 Tax=Brachionus plicatilis TaxID=10195 RepID=A0A3M7PNS0_BRAPC|nr:hypothetical protein BpHYR1_024823 [Brachionus plicatilis]